MFDICANQWLEKKEHRIQKIQWIHKRKKKQNTENTMNTEKKKTEYRKYSEYKKENKTEYRKYSKYRKEKKTEYRKYSEYRKEKRKDKSVEGIKWQSLMHIWAFYSSIHNKFLERITLNEFLSMADECFYAYLLALCSYRTCEFCNKVLPCSKTPHIMKLVIVYISFVSHYRELAWLYTDRVSFNFSCSL